MIRLVDKCVCGCVATETICVDNKSIQVCSNCWSKGMEKLLQMSVMVKQGTPLEIANNWSRIV